MLNQEPLDNLYRDLKCSDQHMSRAGLKTYIELQNIKQVCSPKELEHRYITNKVSLDDMSYLR
jgi:hypothetical protein